MKKKIVIISGPTAVGKSALAVEVALKFGGEVVGADSMQVYKGMNIGTGKVTEEETRGVPHHLIDVAEPDEKFSVGRYVSCVEECVDEIFSRSRLPVLVGGTGLYVNAIINGMNLPGEAASDVVRERWKATAKEKGLAFVYDRLTVVDPVSARAISPSDEKRIIRALEIYETTGKPKSRIATTSECKYDYIFIVLESGREALYNRINARVEKMFADGLIGEVEGLRRYAGCQSMEAIGYKQTLKYFDGGYGDTEELICDVKKLSRNYAKRQMTFLRGVKSPRKCYVDVERQRLTFDLVDKFLSF